MKIHSSFKMTNMQTRVEMAGDKPDRGAVTMSVKGSMNQDEIKMLFSTESQYKKVLGHFWDKDGDLAIADLGTLPLTVEVNGGNAIITNGFQEKHDFNGVKVTDVYVTPLAGRECDVTAKISVYPDKDSLWFLFKHQKLNIDITCTPGQMTVDEGADLERERAEKSQDQAAEGEQPQDGDILAGDGSDNPFEGMDVE